MKRRRKSKMKIIWGIGVFAFIVIGLIYLLGNNNIQIIGTDNQSVKADYSEYEEIGQNAYVSSIAITDTITGVGPFDDDDNAGNDSSADNNIVRSFDQITWSVESTFSLKDASSTESYTGGVICVKASVPSAFANLVEWDVSSMAWAENATVSDDGTELTAYYTMTSEQKTVPGKQTLVLILQVYGVGNKMEIIPTFNISLYGNDDEDTTTKTGDTIYASAAPSYNISLANNSELSKKTTVDYGEGDTSGRMYGYGLVLQLYNADSSKGLKGIEYPDGEITFDINLTLTRTEFNSTTLTDITSECTPVLWNYKINENVSTGIISDRTMLFGNVFSQYYKKVPYGILLTNERNKSTYNSGDLVMTQNGSTISVSISNYEFDGIFPTYAAFTASSDAPIYGDNIGCFSIGYFQIFIPDNEASTIEDRNYYLTVEDTNFKATSYTGTQTTTQVVTSDDSTTVNHTLYVPGSYDHYMELKATDNTYLSSSWEAGDAKIVAGETMYVGCKFSLGLTNDSDVYSAIKFVKFDGDAMEPVLYEDGSSYSYRGFDGTMTFDVYYVTKKDGTNWTSQTEMNNGNIEDMLVYTSIDEIPDDSICIGIYLESNNTGNIAASSGDNNLVYLPLKIKETAVIGQTYGLTQYTEMWEEYVDRTKYSVVYNNFSDWPTETWTSGYRQYVKTEYDENGEMITGTHNGGWKYGQSILVLGSDLSVSKMAIDKDTGEEKVNYDLDKNEYEVTYQITPNMPKSASMSSSITGVNLTLTDTLPDGLTYVAGSTTRGGESYTEPDVTTNSDGTTTLVWYIYNCTVGESITPIVYKAHINEETTNGKQFENTVVVEELIGDGETSKIGNSEVANRTYTYNIQIINLSSYSIYKTTQTPVIEVDGVVHYKITVLNKTDEDVTDFQLLDILPYNEDSRGTSFNGTYTVNSINISQTNISDSTEITGNTLNLYVTDYSSVRNGVTVKDTNLGTSSIWSSETAGKTIEGELTAYAVIGTLKAGERLEIDIYLQTDGNEPYDLYKNSATAQIDADTVEMETSIITVQVVKRIVDGYVWKDANADGLITDGEKYISGIKVTLVNSNGTVAKDINGDEIPSTYTDENGYYSFEDMVKGDYIVKFQYEPQVEGTSYEFTTKEVGSDVEINSKVDSSGATEVITSLNNIDSPVVIQSYVNAGILLEDAQITDSEITKTADIETITAEGESITYNIEYTETLSEYEGDAIITVVDSFPHEIEDGYAYTAKLNGSEISLDENSVTYDEEEKTLTFEIPVDNINTYEETDEKFVITVEISITVNYTEIAHTATSITNYVTGKIYLKENLQENEEEAEETIPVSLKTEVTVSKTWKTEEDASTLEATINLYQDGEYCDTVTLIGNSSYTFENLDKYDTTDGHEYVYTAEEAEITGYTSEVDSTGLNITNTSTTPLISVEKTADKTSGVQVGDTITYTMVITNIGYVELTNIALTDTIIVTEDETQVEKTLTVYEDEACTTQISTISSLAVGESKTVYTTYTVTQDDVDSENTIVNNINVKSSEGAEDEDEAETTPTESETGLNVEKVADITQDAKVGDTITYTVKLENTGNVTLKNVSLTDKITTASGEESITLYSDEDCTAGNEVTTIARIEVGNTATVYATYTVTQDDIDSGTTIVNTITATDGTLTGTDTAETEVEDAISGMNVEKTASITQNAEVGDKITYTIKITNAGNVTLENVGLVDKVTTANGDLNLTIYTDKDCTAGNEVTTIAKIEVGTSIYVYTTYTVTQDDIDNGATIVNKITATDGTLTGTDTAKTEPEDKDPAIDVEKTASITQNAKVGDTVIYTINVTNTGNVTLKNVKLTDEVTKTVAETEEDENTQSDNTENNITLTLYTDKDCTGGNEISSIESLAVGETLTVYAKYEITQDDIDNQYIILNTVTVTDGNVEDEDSATTTPEGITLGLDVEKTANIVEDAKVGDEITYTIKVTNTGNATLTNVELTDEIATKYEDTENTENTDSTSNTGNTEGQSITLYTDENCTEGNEITTISSLAVGETITLYAKYVVTQDDIDAQTQIVNTVTAKAGSAEDEDIAETTPTEYSPKMSVEKTANVTQDAKAGDEIIYTINVTNTGYVTLTDVEISDVITLGSGEEEITEYKELTVYYDEECSVGNEVSSIDRIEVGETLTLYAKYVVMQDDIDNGVTITNTVTATVEDQTKTSTAITTVEEASPDITVNKTASILEEAKAGDEIIYTIIVTNTGNITIYNIDLVDTITTSTGESSLTLYKDQGCTKGNEITEIESLAVGETITLYAKYTVTDKDMEKVDSIVNTITVTSGELTALSKVETTLCEVEEDNNISLPSTGGKGAQTVVKIGIIIIIIGYILNRLEIVRVPMNKTKKK